jgi:hypothetical protein
VALMAIGISWSHTTDGDIFGWLIGSTAGIPPDYDRNNA